MTRLSISINSSYTSTGFAPQSGPRRRRVRDISALTAEKKEAHAARRFATIIWLSLLAGALIFIGQWRL